MSNKMRDNKFSGFKGLSWRIFTVSALCMLIPMLISLFTASYFSQKHLEDSASKGLLNIAVEKRNQIELALSDLEKQAQSIAMQPTIVDSLNQAITTSTNPSQTDLQKISKNLQGNFELGDGVFESKALGSTPNRQEGQTPKDSDNLPRSSKVMSCWFISHKIIIQ